MEEEEAVEEESGGADAVMVNGVQFPASGSSAESEGAAKRPRKGPVEENKGAPKDNQTREDRAEPTVPSLMEDNDSSAKGSPIEID